jgi:S1-C subfamily serine protease
MQACDFIDGCQRWVMVGCLKAASSLLVGVALLATAAGMVAAGPLADLEREQQALFARVQPSIVVISDGRGLGSGFFVSRDGLILTNAHVVGTATEVDVVTPEGNKLRGKVIERAADGVDLALVEVPWKQSPPLVLSQAPLRIGAWVGAVGHGMGGVCTFTTGMISNIYPQGQERSVFQTQIPLNPGNSGGPVFDKDGRVVGIVTAGIRESNNINFAIRADLALTRLTRLVDRCDCLVLEAPKGALLFVDDQHVGSGPRVVWTVAPGEHQVMATMGGVVWRQTVRFPETRKIVVPAQP